MNAQRIDPATVVVHNRTTADLRPYHEHFLAVAGGAVLPEELADLFTTTVTHKPDGKVWVHVDFA